LRDLVIGGSLSFDTQKIGSCGPTLEQEAVSGTG
jgi:hypothetical protein